MNAEYLKMIEIINSRISKFNEFLIPSRQLPMIDKDKINDNSYFTKLTEISWLDLRFPNAEKRGIYFIFGYDAKDQSRRAMYIGKASFSSSIGKRLYAHLKKDSYNENYTMNDLNGNVHHLEYVFGLDLESVGLNIFSSAIEEFLIQNVKSEIYLLNGTGNYD